METPKVSKNSSVTGAFGLRGKNTSSATKPLWSEMPCANPFLDGIAQLRRDRQRAQTALFKEDPFLYFSSLGSGSSFDSSGDELEVHQIPRQSSSRIPERSKSVSELLDVSGDPAHALQNTQTSDQIREQERAACKMVYKWLQQRQLARSCLDLKTINQRPEWAQALGSEKAIACSFAHDGGSLQLPLSGITIHVPQGHVAEKEFQVVNLRAFLDPPQMLNHHLSCTVSPLLEITLSNLNTREPILLEMKIGAEVREDPFSQLMADVVCLHSLRRDGPFKALSKCYLYKDTVQVKLTDLHHVMFLVVAAQTKVPPSPQATIWDYIHKTTTVGIYGPKYLHPRFTIVALVCAHSYMPRVLRISDMKNDRQNTYSVVFYLWGKHSFLLEKPQDLIISVSSCDPDFEVETEGQRQEMKQNQLQAGQVVRRKFLFSSVDPRGMQLFVFKVKLESRDGQPVTQFLVTTRAPAHNTRRLSSLPISLPKKVKSASLLPAVHIKYPMFQDKMLNFTYYAVTLKTVLRQTKIEYLLDYSKGETVALLGQEKVKAIGMSKVKEWYVGVLRGEIGLISCKNIKVIEKMQALFMSPDIFTTRNLLEQISLPFKKLTYIYSVVLTLVSEKVNDWKVLADVLGYSHLALEEFDQIHENKESEKVSYILHMLKEDCHQDVNPRKFLYELVVALLKMDCQWPVLLIIQEAVILTSAVKLGKDWRELAEKLVQLTKQQMEAYEIPHRGRTGVVADEMMWKPAYDFLYTWSRRYENSYREMLQDLQSALDKMKSPVTKQWRELTGVLILVDSLEVLKANAFSSP